MDAAKKKALFRSKLNALRKEKRIDSPLVRYNESDQPVCRVCNVVLKSEALWDAHQASRKHHEAIENFKANAAGKTLVKNVEDHTESARSKHEEKAELPDKELEPLIKSAKTKASSGLPPDFFDNQDTKRQKTGKIRLYWDFDINEKEKMAFGIGLQKLGWPPDYAVGWWKMFQSVETILMNQS